MNARILAAACVLALSGCATLQEANIGNPDTYAKCAVADAASTAIGLSINGMHEINPLTKALTIKAFGPVLGTVVPVIGLSIATYYLLKAINRPAATATMTAITCFSATRNLYLIR